MKIVKIVLIYLAVLVVAFGAPSLIAVLYGFSLYQNSDILFIGSLLTFLLSIVATVMLGEDGSLSL